MDGMLESGKPGLDGMKYRVAMQLVQNGGESSVSPENGICLKNGQEAWLILSAAIINRHGVFLKTQHAHIDGKFCGVSNINAKGYYSLLLLILHHNIQALPLQQFL